MILRRMPEDPGSDTGAHCRGGAAKDYFFGQQDDLFAFQGGERVGDVDFAVRRNRGGYQGKGKEISM